MLKRSRLKGVKMIANLPIRMINLLSPLVYLIAINPNRIVNLSINMPLDLPNKGNKIYASHLSHYIEAI